MKTIIYTSFDCLVKNGREDLSVDKNEFVVIDNPQNIYIYPVGKKSLIPFAVDIDSESPFYRVIKKEDRTLVFLLDGIFTENIEKHSFSNSGKNCDIEVSPSKVSFSTKTRKKILSLPNGSRDFYCGNFFHIVYVKFSLEDEESIILFNMTSSQAKVYYGRKIEIDEDGFTIKNDNFKQSFFIDKDGLKVKESKSLSSPSFCQQMIAVDFLEHIKNYDHSAAFSLLSPELASSQSEQSLKEFFGEISYIYPLDPQNIFAISNGANKLFTFEFEKGKITDIQV